MTDLEFVPEARKPLNRKGVYRGCRINFSANMPTAFDFKFKETFLTIPASSISDSWINRHSTTGNPEGE
jgi:hypothetical protein